MLLVYFQSGLSIFSNRSIGGLYPAGTVLDTYFSPDIGKSGTEKAGSGYRISSYLEGWIIDIGLPSDRIIEFSLAISGGSWILGTYLRL